MKEEIYLRKAISSDVPFLIKLRIETMEEHLVNEGISLTMNQHKERIIDKFENAQIILSKNQEIGFLKLIKDKKGYEIEQFQIDKKHQGLGIGRTVLNRLIEEANNENLDIKLSVFKSNKAQFLYERLGFVKVRENRDSYFMKKKSNSPLRTTDCKLRPQD